MWMKHSRHDARLVHAAGPSYTIFDGRTPPVKGNVSVPQFKFTSLRCHTAFGQNSYSFWNFTKIHTSFPVSKTHQTFEKLKSASLQNLHLKQNGQIIKAVSLQVPNFQAVLPEILNITFASQLIWLATGFSIWRPGFDPRAIYMQFVVDKVTMKRFSTGIAIFL